MLQPSYCAIDLNKHFDFVLDLDGHSRPCASVHLPSGSGARPKKRVHEGQELATIYGFIKCDIIQDSPWCLLFSALWIRLSIINCFTLVEYFPSFSNVISASPALPGLDVQ
ncbi:hypothetical protein AVEN_176768-1 [Araneus ventricosus]|uniref:Uncharacterized protein n=1 Tax=Araneus ventricosus TaxID=182803 RepID=A0A4Y2LJW0_ARAVE|nr:hypothetical protein AVEN_176768-1 [Araneus ventricosus]